MCAHARLIYILRSWKSHGKMYSSNIIYIMAALLVVEIATLTRANGKTTIHILTADETNALIKKHEEAVAKAEAEQKKKDAASSS